MAEENKGQTLLDIYEESKRELDPDNTDGGDDNTELASDETESDEDSDKGEDKDKGKEADPLEGAPENVRQMVKDLTEKAKTYETKAQELSAHERDATAFRDLIKYPQARQLIADIVSGKFEEGAGKEEAVDFSKLDFEKMSEADIAGTITKAATQELKNVFGAEIRELKSLVNQLVNTQSESSLSSKFSNAESYPLAKENETAIRERLQKGYDFDDAYFAVVGKQLKEMGIQEGLKKAKEKKDKDMPPEQKGKANSIRKGNGKIPDSLKEIARQELLEAGERADF